MLLYVKGGDYSMKRKIMALLTALTIGSSFSPLGASAATGPGGISELTYLSSSRMLDWNVKPATTWPYHFSGLISYSAGYSGSTSISGTGFGWEGDVINAPGPNNVYIYASLSGTAYAIDGDAFRVLPGVGTSYTKR